MDWQNTHDESAGAVALPGLTHPCGRVPVMPGRPPVILSGPTGRYRSDPEPLKDRQLSISHGLPGITACIYFPDRVQPASRIHRDMMELLDKLPQVMVEISDEQVRVLIHYIVNAGDSVSPEFMRALAERLPQHEDKLMTIAERLEQKGRQEGRMEGEPLPRPQR